MLRAQAKTSLNSGLIVCGLLAVVFGTLTAAFILVTLEVERSALKQEGDRELDDQLARAA